MTREVKIPGPDHPITVTPTRSRVSVHVGDRVIADSTRALTLQEADYPPSYYIPLEDVDADVLTRTEHETYCPFKGEASYYTVTVDDTTLDNVIWTYERPYDAVAEIAGHVAFYPNRVDVAVG
jgi:uncharacterized protein (DUF427 family)